MRLSFESRDPAPSWWDRVPLPVLALVALICLGIVALHLATLLDGAFPVFGSLATGHAGLALIGLSSLCLTGLVWGLLGLRRWAWWGALTFVGLLGTSVITTFVPLSWATLLSRMPFPPTEIDFLEGLPFNGAVVAAAIWMPLLVALALLGASRRHFLSP